MKLKKFSLLAAACLLAPLTATTAATGVPTVPIDVWAQRDDVVSVDISPNGENMVVLRLEPKSQQYVMELYKTNDLSKPWRLLNAKPMEIISARFISDGMWPNIRA